MNENNNNPTSPPESENGVSNAKNVNATVQESAAADTAAADTATADTASAVSAAADADRSDTAAADTAVQNTTAADNEANKANANPAVDAVSANSAPIMRSEQDIQSTNTNNGTAASVLSDTIAGDDKPDDVPLLQLVNVVKRYGSKTILKSLSFSIGRGGIIGLLGPNGSGKTTIIKLINRLLVPNSGQILLNGRPVDVDSASVISYLPERSYLPLGDRVCDIIDYFSDFYVDFDRRKAYEMLTRLKINSRDRIRTLSKGTREKVQLMLVMSRRAQLYILDEPLGGVDPAARDFILDTILANYHEDGSIIISTHLIADIERILDDVIFIADGQAMLCASVKSIHTKHQKTVDELFREVYRC